MTTCALLDCEVSDNTQTLQEIINDEDYDDIIRDQALTLIEKYGFKTDDVLCDDCFWK
jgi:predicted secreted protein